MMGRVFIIALTLLLAIALSIVTIPSWAIWLRPLWVPMVMCAWILLFPELIGIGFAFMLGIFMDVLVGTLLGEHAFVLTFLAFVCASQNRRLLNLPMWQQTMSMVVLLFGYLLTLNLIQNWLGQPIATWQYWLPLFTSAMIWSPLFLTCRHFTYSSQLREF